MGACDTMTRFSSVRKETVIWSWQMSGKVCDLMSWEKVGSREAMGRRKSPKLLSWFYVGDCVRGFLFCFCFFDWHMI